jgi:hypothetical protein
MNAAGLYILETLKSFRGLKSTAEKAIEQLPDDSLHYFPAPESNSVAMLIKHISGNMISRFTDFYTSDGEKPSRNRDSEFIDGGERRDELMSKWEQAWDILFKLLAEMKEEDLLRTVYIRNEEHTVLRALNRQLVHYAYHTGQIVYLCKIIRKNEFQTLSIPKGKSSEYIANTPEK